MKIASKTIEYKDSVYYSAMELLDFLIMNNIKIIKIKDLREYIKIDLLKFIDSLEILVILDKIYLKKGGEILVKGDRK